jgi:predicted secreted hydrolase
MWRWVLVGAGVLVVVLLGFSLVDVSSGGDVSASAVIDISQEDISGYSRAVEPYDWNFPADFGEHPGFQTEWWYYTGNLFGESGERFGFQFTVFRRALSPVQAEGSSEWRTDQVYMAHFTVSDVAAGKFYQDERYSRGGAGLAGAVTSPRYHVWLENWQILALNDDATKTTIRAASSNFAVDLTLEQVKPPALQGNNGLSPKSSETGNASYYYSLSRLITNGTVTVEGRSYTISGVTWKDHEFSTSALGGTAKGWDWFGLIFDNNTELMLGQIRLLEGGKEPAFGGLMIQPDGSTVYLPSSAFTITAKDTWTSPHTGAVYPAGWDIVIKHEDINLSFTVTPAMPDQELYGSGVVYWEGASDVTGDVTGVGYAELTGYVDTMQGRF